MIFIGRSIPVAAAASGVLALGLSSCGNVTPLEMRCAAFFFQLSNADGVGDVDPSRGAAHREHALAFIDRMPGDRAENIEKMRQVGGSIMADDGLRQQCDEIIPSLEQGRADP